MRAHDGEKHLATGAQLLKHLASLSTPPKPAQVPGLAVLHLAPDLCFPHPVRRAWIELPSGETPYQTAGVGIAQIPKKLARTLRQAVQSHLNPAGLLSGRGA